MLKVYLLLYLCTIATAERGHSRRRSSEVRLNPWVEESRQYSESGEEDEDRGHRGHHSPGKWYSRWWRGKVRHGKGQDSEERGHPKGRWDRGETGKGRDDGPVDRPVDDDRQSRGHGGQSSRGYVRQSSRGNEKDSSTGYVRQSSRGDDKESSRGYLRQSSIGYARQSSSGDDTTAVKETHSTLDEGPQPTPKSISKWRKVLSQPPANQYNDTQKVSPRNAPYGDIPDVEYMDDSDYLDLIPTTTAKPALRRRTPLTPQVFPCKSCKDCPHNKYICSTDPSKDYINM